MYGLPKYEVGKNQIVISYPFAKVYCKHMVGAIAANTIIPLLPRDTINFTDIWTIFEIPCKPGRFILKTKYQSYRTRRGLTEPCHIYWLWTKIELTPLGVSVIEFRIMAKPRPLVCCGDYVESNAKRVIASSLTRMEV